MTGERRPVAARPLPRADADRVPRSESRTCR